MELPFVMSGDTTISTEEHMNGDGPDMGAVQNVENEHIGSGGANAVTVCW